MDHHQRLKDHSKDPFAKATTSNRAPRLGEVKLSVRVLFLVVYILLECRLFVSQNVVKNLIAITQQLETLPSTSDNVLQR